MLAELRRHAAAGAHIRGDLEKRAGLAGAAVRTAYRGAKAVARPVTTWALTNPGKAFVLGSGTMATAGRFGRIMQNFNPAVQRHQLGMEP